MAAKKIHLFEPMSEEDRARYARQRRHDDHVDELPDGFSLVADGRDGVVYYREGARVIELPYELDSAGDHHLY